MKPLKTGLKEEQKMDKYKLPINYNDLTWKERSEVRKQYIRKQNGKCMYCNCDLDSEPSEDVKRKAKRIDWNIFPKNFLKYPIHLQHNHNTGMTEGVVHALCNAVMWQYHGQ